MRATVPSSRRRWIWRFSTRRITPSSREQAVRYTAWTLRPLAARGAAASAAARQTALARRTAVRAIGSEDELKGSSEARLEARVDRGRRLRDAVAPVVEARAPPHRHVAAEGDRELA